MAPTPEAAAHAEKVVDATVEKWDSYVCELGRAEGEFLGGGADALGLHGAPENGATWGLMNGIHPVTGERFHTPYWTKVAERLVIDENNPKGKRLVSAPSYAAVFAAPKSVSMLLATGYRDEALESWRAAVGEATRFLDSQWRVRDRSGSHESLGLIATSYEHHTPRLEDPECHLHTHLTIMNFGQRASDGKWLAGDFTQYLRIQKAAGIVLQAALRAELAQRMPGIEFELHDNGTADIAQIPEAVRERFSTRRAKVIEEDREAAKRGIGPGFRRMDYATYKTRSSKHVLDPREWLERQRVALAEVGVSDESIAAWAEQQQAVLPPSWEVRREELADRLFGPEGLTEKRNTFNRWDVMEQVGMAHYTDMESYEQLIARTDELLADPRVVAVDDRGRYTVTEILEKEESVLETQRRARPRAAARSGRKAIVRDMITDAELRQGWVFNAGQRAVIEALATSDKHVEVVEALAGTGKTKSLGMLAEILEADGVHVIGAAPTGRARLELIQEAGITDSYTLASLKLRCQNGEQVFDRSQPFVLAVDEAGFSATRELADVFHDAIAAGGQIVLVGDSGQLGSVGAGGLFAAISRERAVHGQAVYRLTDVMRQRTRGGGLDEIEVGALEALHSANPDEWIALREERGQLHVHVGRDAGVRGIEHAANLYLDALARNAAEDLYLLSADNAVREAVNARVRETLVDSGVIVEAGEIGGRKFARGERITLRDNDNKENLVNGMRATILEVDTEAGTLTVAIDGKHRRVETLNYEYVTGFTDSSQQRVQGGYANTIHTSQGGTVNETIIVGAAQGLDRQRGYVAASRARHATYLVTWDGSAPEYFAEHELTVAEHIQQVRGQLRDALQRSGVEPSATEQIADAGEQLQLDLDTGSSDVAVGLGELEMPLSVEPSPTTRESEPVDHVQQAEVPEAAPVETDPEQQISEWRTRNREIDAQIRAGVEAGEISGREAGELQQRAHQENFNRYREVLDQAIRDELATDNPWMNSIPERLRGQVAYTRLADGITDPRLHPVTRSRYPTLWAEIEQQRQQHQAAEREQSSPAQVAPNPARDRYLAQLEAITAVGARLSEPWAQQAAETKKLTDAVTRAKHGAEAHARTPEPPVWERAQRQGWRQRQERADTALQDATERARLAREELARYGDPDALIAEHAQLIQAKSEYVGSVEALEMAYKEEIARSPAYLAEAIGPQPADPNYLRRWTAAARSLIKDRWDRGILHDQAVTPSHSAQQTVEQQYLRHVRERDRGRGHEM